MEVWKDTKEMHLSCIFIQESGNKHNKSKVDLQNDFTTGEERYPKNRQENLMILDKYTKSGLIQNTNSEGTSFAQRGGASNKKLPPYY